MPTFAFVQFEFGHVLGPADGRYLIRGAPDAPPERVVVLGTLGTVQRRGLLGRGGRKHTDVSEAEPEPVPTARATLIAPDAFESAEEAAAWLARVRKDEEEQSREVALAAAALNRVLRAHRSAALDPYAQQVSADGALVIRIGHGSGDQVADGRYADAIELPRGRRPRKRHEALQPQERLAAMLGGREEHLACEELFLRARADIDAHRPREAALQARIALETMMAELGDAAASLGEHREPISKAANAALSKTGTEPDAADVEAAVTAMERVLRRRAAGM